MSGILIGAIVLVFLIILAGAFFIGRQVMTARHDTYAASSISAVQQISQAVNLHNASESIPTPCGRTAQELMDMGYLNRMPSIPAGAEPVRLIGEDGSPDGKRAMAAVMKLAQDGDVICEKIARQNGGSSVETITDAIPAGRGGCFITKNAVKSLEANSLYAYNRI
jgi:hypothetical protein